MSSVVCLMFHVSGVEGMMLYVFAQAGVFGTLICVSSVGCILSSALCVCVCVCLSVCVVRGWTVTECVLCGGSLTSLGRTQRDDPIGSQEGPFNSRAVRRAHAKGVG